MADPLFRNLTEVLDEGERTGDLYTAVPVLKESLSRMVRTKKLSYERVTTFTDFARERYGLNIELDADVVPKPDTMPMVVHVLKNAENKYVKIYEMQHIAPASFYDLCQNSWARDVRNDYLLHVEGVSGTEELGLDRVYKELAELIGRGWEAQEKPNVSYERHDMNFNQIPWYSRLTLKTYVTITRFFLRKLRESSPQTREKIHESAKKSSSEPYRVTGYARFINLALATTKRNRYAIEQVLATDRNVALIWGAAHAQGMIKLLQKQGYSLLGS